MNKNDLIKQLYADGKITFDEALTLASKEPTFDPLNNMCLIEGTIESRQAKRDEKVIEDIIYRMSVKDIDEDGHDYSFDIPKIVEFMNVNDWTWGWNAEKVTKEKFRDQLQDLCRDVLRLTIKDYRDGKYNPDEESGEFSCYHCTGTGGIEVASYIDEDEIMLEAKFVAEQAVAGVELAELKELEEYNGKTF